MPRTSFHTDPTALAEEVERCRRSSPNKLLLGLDLGSNCGYGWAYHRPGTPLTAADILPHQLGQLDLSAGSYDSGAIRFVRLRHFLAAFRPDAVFYEHVRFTPPKLTKVNQHAILARTATASEFLGALKATVCTWCEEYGVPCTGFSIQTIKKRATGKGNASKEDVIRACNETFGTTFELEGYENSGVDNIADASFCCLLGLEQYGHGLPTTEDPAG